MLQFYFFAYQIIVENGLYITKLSEDNFDYKVVTSSKKKTNKQTKRVTQEDKSINCLKSSCPMQCDKLLKI